ncbi:MAG: TlpA family protein disulfide reductase [Planctomycetota bacterium]
MFHVRPTLLWLFVMAAISRLSAVSADEAKLVWSNGDSLRGELISADNSAITWKSPLFNEPLQIRLSAISTVSFPRRKMEADASLFRIVTRNGDVLFGELKEVGENTLTFEGQRFGRFTINRNHLQSMQRSAEGRGIIYSGPRGLEGWQPAFRRSTENNADNGQRGLNFARVAVGGAPQQPVPEASTENSSWTESPDGSIQTSKLDAALFLNQKLPQRYEVEFEIDSPKRPAFALVFGRDAREGLRIESWIDVLVAANGTSFTTLQQLPESGQTLHLHAFIDHDAKKMAVFNHTGDRLGEVELKGLRGGVEGITIRNGEQELKLRKLTIRNWDGTEPQIRSDVRSRFYLADGTVRIGNLTGFKPESGMVIIDENGTALESPLDQISSMTFPETESSETILRGETQLAWNDGGYVSGKLVSVSDGIVLMTTLYSADPIRCQLNDALRLSLLPGATEDTQTDRLFHEGESLQGSLVVDGAADTPILWRPLGGLTAATLRSGGNARIVRGREVRHFSETPELFQTFPDVLYLQNNDVVPCRFQSLNDTDLILTMPFSDMQSVPQNKVRAVELGATGRIHQQGFTDAGWKGFSKKDTERSKMTFRGSTRYSHPQILTGDTIRFHMKWPIQSYSSLTLSMFGNGTISSEEATYLTFTIMQATLQVSNEKPKGNANQNPMMFRGFGMQNPNETIQAAKGEVDVELVARDGKLNVSIDGKQVRSFPLNMAGAGRKGIAFSAYVQSLGNVVVNGRVQNSGSDAIEISNFEIDNLSGASVRQFIEEEVRQMTLTVPRFRRDNPPTHVLIAANGDVLRGQLISLSDSEIVFESRLEKIRIDRNRIAGIVWLDPPAKETAPKLTRPAKSKADASAESPAGLDLADPTGLISPAIEVVIGGLEGANVAISSGDSGKAAIATSPGNDDAVAPSGVAPGENMSEKNTADGDGFVVVDEVPDGPGETIGDGRMQAILADGFSITMIPVRLENGQIRAKSDLLGDCVFPAATIRELTIGNPTDRNVVSSYEQWIARRAPEPDWDIAAEDGGNSAGARMIGQPAPDFELTLLDGTTFRLKDHADKIVVLDFWATWCGPCVAALPDYVAACRHFDASKLMFVAVNQQEAPDQIRRFLEEKQLSPIVALDRDGSIGQKFDVSGIPHTVIIGAGGIVEDVHVGYQSGAGEEMQMSLQQMLDGTWKRPSPNAPAEEEPRPDKEPDGV